jgi:hypothetical protein
MRLSGARNKLLAVGDQLLDLSTALLILRMATWVVVLSFMFRFISMPRTMRYLTPRKRDRIVPEDPSALQDRMARFVDALLRLNCFAFSQTCWKRAAVLYRFLALHGIDSRILFGVRKDADGQLEGHAWLERGGIPILERSIPDYKITYSFP